MSYGISFSNSIKFRNKYIVKNFQNVFLTHVNDADTSLSPYSLNLDDIAIPLQYLVVN